MKGKYIVVGLAVVAAGMAVFAWWVRFQHSQRVMKLWGDEGTLLLRKAPVVQLHFYEPDSDDPLPDDWEVTSLRGKAYRTYGPIDLVGEPGFTHARHALLEDVSYDWGSPVSDETLSWTFGLTFVAGDEQLTLYFAPEDRVVSGETRDTRMTEVLDRITAYVARYHPKYAASTASASEGGKQTPSR